MTSWNGLKCLSLVNNSSITLNPKDEISKRLESWFESNYLYIDIEKHLPNRHKLDSLNISHFTKDIRNEDLEYFNGEFVKLSGKITYISTKCHEICPVTDCSMKKAIQISKTKYRCSKCNTTFEVPKILNIYEVKQHFFCKLNKINDLESFYRYLKVTIDDDSSSLRTTIFEKNQVKI